MIAYEVLCQAIVDWKAGARPSTSSSHMSMSGEGGGEPQAVEELESGLVEMDAYEDGVDEQAEYTGSGEYAASSSSSDEYAGSGEYAAASNPGAEYDGSGEYAAASTPDGEVPAGAEDERADYEQVEPDATGADDGYEVAVEDDDETR